MIPFCKILQQESTKSPNGFSGDFAITDPKQSGQTFIETLVAIFVLVMGLVSALSLATYSLGATNNSSKQVVGTALARQGIDAIKNIRDNNWLISTATNCSYPGGTQLCRTTWASGIPQGTFAVDYNTSTNSVVLSTNNPATYILNYNPLTGQYRSVANFPNPYNPSVFYREVLIKYITSAPYNTPNNQQIDIISTVWWAGRGCIATSGPNFAKASCKVSLEMHLTNWKNN